MRSNYKRIGDYVQQVNIRNKDLSVTSLKGININKVFMPSVANTTGTDMAKYKAVLRGQFAYNPMHVGRDEVLPIGMLEEDEAVIVSPAYTVFEVINTEQLLPEYLMMWCRRGEFDRNAWFTTDSSVRGGFSWKDFCDLELPIPSPEKQREIVREYHTVTNRIKLNEQLNQKLEETAQTIYRQWFVEFEFSDENGNPYKSSGGEMEYCEELEQEIPKGWEEVGLENMSTCLDHLRKPLSAEERSVIKGDLPYYGAMSIVDYINTYIYEGIHILVSEDGANVVDDKGRPAVQYVWGKFWVNNHAHVLQGKNDISTEFLMLALKTKNIAHLVTGAAQPKINQKNLMSIRLLKPNQKIITKFDGLTTSIFTFLRVSTEITRLLKKLTIILLSKMATIE